MIPPFLPLKIRRMLPGNSGPSLQTWRLTGLSKNQQHPLEIKVIGKNENKYYWLLASFFSPGARIENLGVQRVDATLLKHDTADLVILQATQSIRKRYNDLPSLDSQCWLSTGLPLKDIKALCKQSPNGMKRAAGRIRNQQLTYEIHNNEERFNKAVTQIIYPYLKWRHQDECLWNEESIFDSLNTHELLDVIRDGETIASCVFSRREDNNTIHLNKIGIRLIN